MANIDYRDFGQGVEGLRRQARLDGHVHRAQTMLVAAGLSALGVVAVAGVLLSNIF